MTWGRLRVRRAIKSTLLGIAGAQLVVRTPASLWEWSDTPLATRLLLDGLWVLLLSGLPAIIGWPPRQAWRGAAATTFTTVASSGLWLAVSSQTTADAQAALVLRTLRIGAEGMVITLTLALTGAWLVLTGED